MTTIAPSPEADDVAGGVPVLRPAALSGVSGLVAGITARIDGGGRGGDDDFGLSTGGSAWAVAARYRALADGLGFAAACVCVQVHGTDVVDAGLAPASGVWIAGEADGFAGQASGRLFAVTVADCAPVYLIDPDTRAFALLHAGWRGAAAGILGRTVERLRDLHGRPASLHLHLGPSICGECYEVGPEVPRAFGRRAEGKSTIDVGMELVRQARELGIAEDRISRSTMCPRCDGDRLYSHRGGGDRAGRMAAWLGWAD